MMNSDIERSTRQMDILFITILVLIPFALFPNLGLMPLLSDEPTRGIVTLEMIISGDWITPTISGDFYYNKPPLYNWLQIAFIKSFGRCDEFIFRLPTTVSLILMGIVIYIFATKAFTRYYSLASALMFITSARILFWDSFQGLIDITYSLVTFGSFVALYSFSEKRNYTAMFVATYLLAAVGFLLKGVPSLVFQGISLVIWMVYEKSFRKLFTWQHLIGIAVFLLITGSYYLAYLQSNSLDKVFATLFSESNRLSEGEGSFLHWWGHIYTFPVEMVYEFAPWTLFIILLFNRRVWHETFRDKFFRYCLMIFVANIIIYWLSANMRARYLFMLFPLFFLILLKAYQVASGLQNRVFRFLNVFLNWIAFAGAFSLLFYLFWDKTSNMPGLWVIIPLLFLVATGAAFFAIRMKTGRILFIVIILMVVRVAFNMFNLPARYASFPDAGYRENEMMVGKITIGHDLYLLGRTRVNHDAIFYISRERMKILPRTNKIFDEPAYYISDARNLIKFAGSLKKFEVVHKFTVKVKKTRLYLIKCNYE